MGPVFELFPVPVEVGEAAGLGEALIVGPAAVVEELEAVFKAPMSTPGGISGLSTKFRFAAVHEKGSG